MDVTPKGQGNRQEAEASKKKKTFRREKMTALSTFGAIMGFAAEMAGKMEEVYKILIPKAKDPSPEGNLAGFGRGRSKESCPHD